MPKLDVIAPQSETDLPEAKSSGVALAAELEAIQQQESAPATPADVKRGLDARKQAKVKAEVAVEDPSALHEGEQTSRVQDSKSAVEAAYHSKRTRDGWETRRENEAAAVEAPPAEPEPVIDPSPEPEPAAPSAPTAPPAPDVKTRDQEPASFIASKQEAAAMAYSEKDLTDPATMLAAHDRAGQSAAEAAVARLAEQGTAVTIDTTPNPAIASLEHQAQVQRDTTSTKYRGELGEILREATVGEPDRVFRTQLAGEDRLAYSEDMRTALGAKTEPFIMSKDRKTHTQFYRTDTEDTFIFERYDKKTNLLVELTVVNGKEAKLFDHDRAGHLKPSKEIKKLRQEGELSVDYTRQQLAEGAKKLTYNQASGEVGFAAAVMAQRGSAAPEITRFKSKNPVKPNVRGFWSSFFSRL